MGNGIVRKCKLTTAGYDYVTVQQRVNEIVEQRKASGKTHVVIKGDTLSAIARTYGTTVKKLCAANNITKPNLIQIGQCIKIA